jgi:phosphatidylinositol alpha-1,6-mannosyltransferase
MVFLEAWMRGKPVIGNAACRPVASLIKDGEDGFLCTSMEQIADRLSKLLNDPVLAKTMGETGKAKVLQRYTWAEVGRRVHAVYLDLIFGHRS